MRPAIGEWGLYQWFEEKGPHLIHPEDIDAFRALMPNSKVFQCIASNDEYLTLQYDAHQFRVKPDLFKPVTSPKFHFGQPVSVRGDAGVTGIVTDIVWHFKENKPFFHISVGGKRLKKRYWAEDLCAPEEVYR